MLCANLLLCILSLGFDQISFKDNSQTYLDAADGVKFQDLSPELIADLNAAKHWDVDNSVRTSTYVSAPNHCWSFGPHCHPDYVHHVFQIEIPEHPGYNYEITFTYDYEVYKVSNGYLHN